MQHWPTYRATLRDATIATRPTLPSHTTGHFTVRTRRSVTSLCRKQSVYSESAPVLPERFCI